MSRYYTDLGTFIGTPSLGKVPVHSTVASKSRTRLPPDGSAWSDLKRSKLVPYFTEPWDIVKSSAIPVHRAGFSTASQSTVSWFQQAQKSLQRLRGLAPGWDSYNAEV